MSFFLEHLRQFQLESIWTVRFFRFEAHLAAPGTAPVQITIDPAGSGTDDLLTAVLRANPRVSDLIFSPGRKLQVQVSGNFVSVEVSGISALSADDTRRIASHLIGNNKAAITMLREQGYCDVSYALPGLARFRVNIFIQRGSCAVVMRVIPTAVPTIASLGGPDELKEITSFRDGLILVIGPRGSGKSSTLAALVDHINGAIACHIITIEDPIEFLHSHKRATVHQRELYSDTPSVSHAMRAALRQAPNVIAVGELKERETTELALDAAEAGHLVLSTLTAPNSVGAIERLVAAFTGNDQASVRERLTRILRLVVCQRLIPRKQDGERVAVFEVVRGDSQALGLRQSEVPLSLQAKQKHTLDSEIERLVRDGTITSETALTHAVDAGALTKKLATLHNSCLR
ncbi:MAG TPA: ATPase, T2SS/T4P/T4SS family [Terriglobales bacterium]